MSTENHIICGGLPQPEAVPGRILRLDVSKTADPRHRIELELHQITRVLADNIPDILADALEIAAYVYSADRLIGRGGPEMARMNAQWRRDLRFRIPVRQPAIWARREVQDALVSALSFLSDDDYSFEFVPGRTAKGIQPYLGFADPDAHVVKPDEVMLFSGGLDSLAGAVDSLIRNDRKMVLVSHQSATHITRNQRVLVQALRQRVGAGRAGHVPVWVGKGGHTPIEYTQRTRSFLFTTLGVTIARMYGLDRVHISENGVTSFNLPISEQAIGTRSSRTTHPRVLAAFSELFSLLLDAEMQIRNRLVWHTKAEVVRSIADADAADLIASTTSCASVRQLSMSGKHCGVCSQCIERRFAMAAAGLEEFEAKAIYVTDLFTGEHSRVQDLTMVEQYVLRAYKHQSMTREAFLASSGQVFRALPYLEGRPDQNAHLIYDLHRRHGAGVVKTVDEQLRSLGLGGTLALPANSLLAMIQSSSGLKVVHLDPIQSEPIPSQEAATDPIVIRSRHIVMAIDADKKRILIEDGPEIKGKGFELIARLAKQHVEDLQQKKLPLKEFSYVPTRTLLREFRIEDPTLRKRIERLRDQLEREFLERCQYHLDREDVVQNLSWEGYRLNPYVRLVDPIQVRPAARTSRVSKSSVTDQPAAR